MDERIKEIARERMEKSLERFLWENEEYVKSRDEYHECFGELRERLGSSKEDEAFLMKFNEMIGAFSSQYEETIYMLGFHDGLGMGLEHREYWIGGIQERGNGSAFTEQDMVHLIYMYDAYRELCTALLGRVVVPELKDGVIGAFCRTLAVIEAHIPADKKGEDDPEYDRLLHDRSKMPEERARLLLKPKL